MRAPAQVSIPASELKPRPLAPEEEPFVEQLRVSIQSEGQLHNIGVLPGGVVLYGHRRAHALQRLGWVAKAFLYRDVTADDARAIAFSENHFRAPPASALDEAEELAWLARYHEDADRDTVSDSPGSADETSVERGAPSETRRAAPGLAPDSPEDSQEAVPSSAKSVPKGGRGKKGGAAKAAADRGVSGKKVRESVQIVAGIPANLRDRLKACDAGHKELLRVATLSASPIAQGVEVAKIEAAHAAKAEKKANAKANANAPTETGPAVDALGNPLPPEVAADWFLAEALGEIRQKLVDAQTLWTKAKNRIRDTRNGRFPHILANLSPIDARMAKEVHQLSHDIGATLPHAWCPECKGHAALVQKCEYCRNTGWVGVGNWERAPVELREGGDKASVWIRAKGEKPKLVRLADLGAEQAA